MSRVPLYTLEFKGQAVRFVLESLEPDESRKRACARLAPKLNVNPVTLYSWVKAASSTKRHTADCDGTVDGLREQVLLLKRENRELVRANTILQDAATFFGAALDRQSRKSPRS
jgi:transposase